MTSRRINFFKYIMFRRVLPFLVGIVIGLLVYVIHKEYERRRHEPFLPLLGVLGKAVIGTAVGFGASAVIDKVVKPKLEGSKGAQGPTFRGRVQDGYDWSCPDGTIETGSKEDAKACITSAYHPFVWKPDDKGKWGNNCPNGTVPAPEGDDNKKCLVGYTGRVQTDKGWECPFGTSDTGANWNNSSWHDAHKQCKRFGPYTRRIQLNKKWVCPPGTKDTGKQWGQPHGEKQCKFTGP